MCASMEAVKAPEHRLKVVQGCGIEFQPIEVRGSQWTYIVCSLEASTGPSMEAFTSKFHRSFQLSWKWNYSFPLFP